MPRSCRWSRSTCTSPATSTPSAAPTTCSRRCSTTTSTGATRWASTSAAITWRRVIDMNDRALRQIVSSLGGVANGFPREDGFDITVASEVMAVFCLATDLDDLERRLGRMIVGYTRDRKPVHRRRPEGRRRDDRAAQGRARAEPRADARGQPRLRPWRPVRQHRAWLQLGDGDPHRAQARRLRGHRGRLRRRPRGREVLRHQVPQGRPDARRRRDRRHRARAQDARRRRQGRAGQGESGGAAARAWPTSTATSRNVRKFGVPVGGGDQPLRHRHRGRARADPQPLPRRARRRGLRLRALGQGLGRHRGAGPARGRAVRGAAPTDGRGFQHLYPDEMPLWDKMRTIAQRDLRRRGHHRRPAGARPVRGVSRPRATATSRSASPRPSTASRPTPTLQGRTRPATSCRSARCASPAGPSSWS